MATFFLVFAMMTAAAMAFFLVFAAAAMAFIVVMAAGARGMGFEALELLIQVILQILHEDGFLLLGGEVLDLDGSVI